MMTWIFAAACAADPATLPVAASPVRKDQAEAVFGMGCFWCGESDFEKLPGVVDAVSAYTGGHVERPAYHDVGRGSTGHAEVVRVIYDPKVVDYDHILEWFWTHIDAVDGGGQFCDRGSQYRPAIFPIGESQKAAATASKLAIETRLGQKSPVTIEASGTVWIAEPYHQDFYKTNPAHYQRYRLGCGRDARLTALWGSSAH